MKHDVHAALVRAVTDLRQAEQLAVTLFAEIISKRLYFELGFASIEEYASAQLGFSAGKTKQFVLLARRLDELPELKRAIANGEITWTAARETASIATKQTEEHWVQQAKKLSRRELSREIRDARTGARRALRTKRSNQTTLVDAVEVEATVEVPVSVTFRFTGAQYSQFLTLLEGLRKGGSRASREELVIVALGAVAAKTPTSEESALLPRRPPHHRIVTYLCASCGAAHTPTPLGDRPVSLPELAARLEDAEVVEPGKRVRRTIPTATRTKVLARDGHRCRVAGCKNTTFLEVHHRIPVSRGGENTLENLLTVCSRCHVALHERAHQLSCLQRGTRVSEPRSLSG